MGFPQVMHYIFPTYRPEHVHTKVVSIAFPYKQRSQLSTCGASVNEVWSSCSLMKFARTQFGMFMKYN
jgi:hypothetical protein